MIRSGLLLITIIFISSSYAQRADFNQTKMRYGEDITFMSARELGLGGSGIAGGDVFSAVSLNPALLFKGNGLLQFSAGIQLQKNVEDRSFPYYDSFVGYNDYGSYAYNEHWYQGFQGILTYNPLQNLSIAAAHLPFKDMRYDYQEEVRDPVDRSDKLLGYNSVVQSGLFYHSSLAVAYQPFKNWSFGLQLGILSAEIDSTMNIDPVPASMQSAAEQHKRSRTLDGMPFLTSLGVHYKYDKRLSFGMNFRLPYEVKLKQVQTFSEDSVTYSAKQSLSYPARVGGGLNYRFENILAANISFDIVYDFWSSFEDNLSPTDYNDTYTLHTGIEHIFFNRIPLRAGFLYGTLRESKDFSRTVLTIGSGFEIQNVQVNLAGGVASQEYYQSDYFADSIYGIGDRSDSDRVKTNQYFVRIDLNYTWGKTE